jgi:hypothetical protein
VENVKGTRDLIRRLEAVGKAATDTSLHDWQIQTVRYAKENTRPNKKTGITSASIQPGHRDRAGAMVEAAGAAVFLEFGTKPHVIVPRFGRVLAWAPDARNRRLSGAPRKGTKSSDLIFARKVNHPGTKPYPFMVPAADRAVEDVFGVEPIVKAWNKAG